MPNKRFYKSKRWQKVRMEVIQRDKDICFFCGQLILKNRTIHHKQELNEENINNELIAYGLDNLVEVHDTCHNVHHDRFGYKSTIVNNDLEIDYSKRTI